MHSAQTAAALADAFIRDALAKARRLAPKELIIAESAGDNARRSSYFRALAREFDARLLDQGSGGLGERMARVLKPFAKHGGAILFGADIPSLPAELLARSAGLFENWPVVLGPAVDGGLLFARLPWQFA